MSENLGRPTLTSLAATILLRRKDYYAALEAANKSNEITSWLAWFAGVAVETQHRTIAFIELLIEKTKLFDRLRDELNHRQTKALLRMFREGPEGFQVGQAQENTARLRAHPLRRHAIGLASSRKKR